MALMVVRRKRHGDVFHTLVDDDVFEEIAALTWYVCEIGPNRRPYVLRAVPEGAEYLHRRLMGLTAGARKRGDHRLVDHKNTNSLDNRRANLRIRDFSGNAQNRGANKNSASGERGVCWDKQARKWVAAHQYRGSRWKKLFATRDEAVVAIRAQHAACELLEAQRWAALDG